MKHWPVTAQFTDKATGATVTPPGPFACDDADRIARLQAARCIGAKPLPAGGLTDTSGEPGPKPAPASPVAQQTAPAPAPAPETGAGAVAASSTAPAPGPANAAPSAPVPPTPAGAAPVAGKPGAADGDGAQPVPGGHGRGGKRRNSRARTKS